MVIVEFHPEPIDRPWIEGFVLDRRVISSRPIAGRRLRRFLVYI